MQSSISVASNTLPGLDYGLGKVRQQYDPEMGISYSDFIRKGLWMVDSDGANVNEYSALKVSVFMRCVTLISETAASLPFSLYRNLGPKGKEIAEKHRTFSLYSGAPNDYQTWFDFIFHWLSRALIHGNGYALIIRNRLTGRPMWYESLADSDIEPFYFRDNEGRLTLYYYVYGHIVEKENVLHIKGIGSDGVVGHSMLELAKTAISTGLYQQSFTNSMYKNGLHLEGVLEHPANLSRAATARLKEQMAARKGSANSGGTLILEEGMKYASIAMKPQEVGHGESRKFTVEEICRFMGVPLHKVAQLDKATNNNIEQQDLEFYKSGVMPWLERIEQEFNLKTLPKDEKNKYFHEFDVKKLLRADIKARMEWINGMFPKGAVDPDELRALEGLNPKGTPEMKVGYMQLAMSPVDKLAEAQEKRGTGSAAQEGTGDTKKQGQDNG